MPEESKRPLIIGPNFHPFYEMKNSPAFVSQISDYEKYMILNERACIGEPIGLLISPSACTFTLSGRCARVKKVRVCAI